MITKFNKFLYEIFNDCSIDGNDSRTNNIKSLKVGDFVVLKHSTPPKHYDMYSSSIINNYAIVTSIPKNTNFVYGRFCVGHSPTKIKEKSISWNSTVDSWLKEKYKKEFIHWGYLKKDDNANENFLNENIISDNDLIREIENRDVTIFSGSFYNHPYGFRFDSYSNLFDTDELYTILGNKYTLIAQDITTDNEREEGVSYSRYEFELVDANENFLNENNNIQDFYFSEVKNYFQGVINNGGLSLKDIAPERYFIIASGFGNNIITGLSTLSKEEASNQINTFKNDDNVWKIYLEKPTIGTTVYLRKENKWITKNIDIKKDNEEEFKYVIKFKYYNADKIYSKDFIGNESHFNNYYKVCGKNEKYRKIIGFDKYKMIDGKWELVK